MSINRSTRIDRTDPLCILVIQQFAKPLRPASKAPCWTISLMEMVPQGTSKCGTSNIILNIEPFWTSIKSWVILFLNSADEAPSSSSSRTSKTFFRSTTGISTSAPFWDDPIIQIWSKRWRLEPSLRILVAPRFGSQKISGRFFTIQSNQVKNHSAPMNWAGISPSFPQTPNAGCCSALPVRVMGWWWEDCYSLNSDNYIYIYILSTILSTISKSHSSGWKWDHHRRNWSLVMSWFLEATPRPTTPPFRSGCRRPAPRISGSIPAQTSNQLGRAMGELWFHLPGFRWENW